MYDRNPYIQAARLVFTADAGGNLLLIKDSYSAGPKEVDLQVMVEKIENLRLAAAGSPMRYLEDGDAEMTELVDGEYDPANPIGGPYRAPDGCSDDCGFDSDEARNGDSSVELPEEAAELIIVIYEAKPLLNQDEYGETGVVKHHGIPSLDAADDLESRGIDASVNVDLVEAWAHALEVADATD